VPVNGRNEAIAPAILNQDNRATTRRCGWNEQSEERHFSKLPACRASHVSCCEIPWLRKHRPDVFTPSVRFLSVIGYILSRLGLPPYIDYSLPRAIWRLIYDSRWSQEILAATEINVECLPIPVPAGTIVGKLDGSGASQLGLMKGTMVAMEARSTLRGLGSWRHRFGPRG